MSNATLQSPISRPVLRKNKLLAALGAVAGLTVLFFTVRPVLPVAWSTPGSPELYLTGVLGAMLCLTPFAFSIAKRSGKTESPPAWFIAHVVASMVGVALLVVHSGLYLRRPPALLLAGGLFLVRVHSKCSTRIIVGLVFTAASFPIAASARVIAAFFALCSMKISGTLSPSCPSG